jgi:hypothetical protein
MGLSKVTEGEREERERVQKIEKEGYIERGSGGMRRTRRNGGHR